MLPDEDEDDRELLFYEDTVARNINAARVRRRLTQAQVAEAMRDLGFDKWVRQTVTEVEKNRRQVTVRELLGLSIALRTDLTMLMFPSPDDAPFGTVRLPDGQLISMMTAFPISDVRVPEESARRRQPGGNPRHARARPRS